jgi:hypothetical protein
MTDHQHDELDELLRLAAQDYNRPGETPHDRMWSEIRAQRLRRAQLPTRSVHRATRRTWFIPAVAAAVLVLGIAIGRVYERSTATPQPTAIAAVKTDSTKIVAVAPDASTATDSSASSRPSPVIPRRTPNAQRSPLTVESPTVAAPRAAQPNLSYQLAVVEHLAGTEAMLTSFRAAAKRGEVDAQMTAWARNLLTTTRLLQSSAAQQDPTMKRLLDDLELVLVQIAQYTSAGTHRAEELELIEHSIERRGVIGKLHTTIPARLGPAGT